MQRSTIRNLWLSSMLLMFSASCAKKNIQNFTAVDCVGKSYWKLFDDKHANHQYKTEVTIYGKYFSGILFLKQVNDTTCRAAFTTVPGAKFFELLITPVKDSVIYTIPQMSNPAVVTAIAKDIRTFALLNKFATAPICLKQDKVEGEIVERKTHQEVYRYFYKEHSRKLNQIQVLSDRLKPKTIFDFAYATNALIPNDVLISHLNFKLKIHLTQL